MDLFVLKAFHHPKNSNIMVTTPGIFRGFQRSENTGTMALSFNAMPICCLHNFDEHFFIWTSACFPRFHDRVGVITSCLAGPFCWVLPRNKIMAKQLYH